MDKSFSRSQVDAALTALHAYVENPFVPHQWVEIVSYLSHSDDPRLRKMIHAEIDAIIFKEHDEPFWGNTR